MLAISPKITLSAIRSFLMISLLGLSLNSLYPFQQSAIKKTRYEFTDTRISEADTLLKKRQYQEALTAYQKAYDTYEAEGFYEGMVYAMERMGRTYRSLRKDSLSQHSYSTAARLSREKLGPNHILESKAYLNNGIRAHRARNFKKAAAYLDSAEWNYQRAFSYDSAHFRLIVRYKYYTYFYSELNSDTLIKYLNERSRLMDSHGQSFEESIILLTDYCAAYAMKGDFEKAEAYGLEATRLSKSSLELINGFYYRDAAYNLARVLNSKAEHQLAIKVTNDLIDYAYKNNLGVIEVLGYKNLKAIILNGMEEYEEAAEVFNEVISELKRTNQTNLAFYRDAVMNLGVCYQLLGNFELAEMYLNDALIKEKKAYELFDSPFISRYKYLAQLFFDQKDYSRATSFYDSALRNSILSYQTGLLTYPAKEANEINYEALSILRDKQLSLEKSYLQGSISDSIEVINATLNYAKETSDLLMTNRSELQASQGRLFMSENFKEVYESALNSIYLIQQSGEDDESHNQLAMKFLSLTKSILFLEQSGELGQVQDSRLPYHVKAKYYKIKSDVEIYEQKFTSLKGEILTNDSLRLINTELLRLNADLKELKDSLSGVFDQENLDLLIDRQNTSQLVGYLSKNPENAVLEYFVGERYIFVSATSVEGSKLYRLEFDSDFTFNFRRVVSIITNKPSFTNFQASLADFQASAFNLYKVLLQPVLEDLSTSVSGLLIVPDDLLSKVPFEALVTSERTGVTGFHELDYLITKYTVSYYFSSKSIMSSEHKRVAPKSIFGIGYSGNNDVREKQAYGALPGTEDEIKFLENELDGDFFYGTEGTRETFLSIAKSYDILHLAIHGSADSVNRYESKLIFNGQDPVLKTSDLYRADLKARLAILSACESGTGGINKGEGTFSIARGFALVGIPSIVMSLWKVTDDLSTEVMVEFYEGLMSGKSTSSALRLAKLKYLESADNLTSHPFFWANYVTLGEDLTLELKPARSSLGQLLFPILVILVLAASLLLFRKRSVDTLRKSKP